MTTQPTNLPVPSETSRDLKFNAGKIDEFVTSLQNIYKDRFGQEHYTIEGLRWVAQQAIAAFGYITMDSFQAGATLTLPNQVLRDTSSGECYRWDGAFPKTVSPGSTPSSSGGISIGAWLSVGDAVLRSQLASPSGGTLVMLASGKTVQQDSEQSGLVRGNDGVKYAISGCAVRRDTSISPEWGPVSDTAHLPINVTSVVGGVDVEINYKGSKIGSLVAGPDESLARDGALVGASVASNKAFVSIGAPCSFSVDLATQTFEFDTHYFDQIRFGLSIGSAGNISVTHPGVRTMLHPIIRYVAPNSTSKTLDVHFQNKLTAGVTSLFLVGDVEGTISYNGTNWVLGSCDQWATSDLTFTWDATKGELTVSHPVLLGSPELVLTPMYLGTPMVVSGLASAGNGFKVQFNKVADGGPPTSPNTGLGFYFSRGKNGIRKNPTGKLLVHLGHVQVNCDQVDYPGGNFWFNAVMQN